MPKRKVGVTGGPLTSGRSNGEALRLGQQSRLIVLQIDDPFQVQQFDRLDERRLEIDGVGD
jgi:hypothetical protein